MNRYDISALFRPEQEYRVIKCIKQQWQMEGFRYLDTPRPDNGILFVTKGQISFVFDGESLEAKTGSLIFLPKGSRYEAVTQPELGVAEDYLINFDTDVQLPQLQPMMLMRTADEWCLSFYDEMTKHWMQEQGDTLWIRGKFILFLDWVIKNSRDFVNPQKERVLRTVCELLENDGCMPVNQIAKRCGISESGLRSMFKKAYGCSPLQYRTKGKISRARYLLEATDMTVYAIAEQLGFYDEAYFCKMFRKYTGFSPKDYLKSRRI